MSTTDYEATRLFVTAEEEDAEIEAEPFVPVEGFYAVTIPMTYTDTIDFFIGGPTCDEADYCVVAAKNKRDARTQGVRAFRKFKSKGLEPGENPFYGMKIYPTCQEEVETAKADGYFFDYAQEEKQ